MSFTKTISPRAFRVAPTVSFRPRTFSCYPRSVAQSGYGDPDGGPMAENPQEQGSNPESHQEHPGPSAPSAASGKSASKSSSSKSSKSSSKSGNKPSPAIHDESTPSEQSADVKKHNQELDQRKEKTHVKEEDEKVDPKFWKGHAGETENNGQAEVF